MTLYEKYQQAKAANQPIRVNGAQAIFLALLDEGVNKVFGYPGGAIMPMYDEMMAFEEANQFKHVLVRHEQGGAHAAQALAQVTGTVGVAFGTSGPGATNLVTGICNANIDSVPMVFITAQVFSTLLGSDAFQETDMVGISMPITKWNYQITKASDIPLAFAKAFHIANTGRKGPVLLDITKDAQIQELDFTYSRHPFIRSYIPYPELKMDRIDEAVDLINNAKKPLLLAGHGILLSNAEKELLAFVEKTGIPVASTLLGLDSFPQNHPQYVGMLGMHGNYGPNLKTNEADLIIGVGMRFDDRVTGKLDKYAKQAKIIHIEIDNAEIDKVVKSTTPIIADAKSALNALIEKVKPNKHEKWMEEFKHCYEIEYNKVIKNDIHPTEGKLRMGEIMNEISEQTNGDAIVCSDVGQHQMAVARYFKWIYPHTNITSGGLGTMGFGLPAALGAKVGRPEKTVICVAGDGGIQMNIQELGTIMAEKIAVKIVIFNNNFLGMVRQWQEMFFDKRYASTDMPTPDFIMIAKAYGIEGKVLDKREDVKSSVAEMLNHPGAYILEVKVGREDKIMPMVPQGKSVSEIILE